MVADYSFSCATNRIIAAKDHGSIQLNLAVLDAEGVYSGEVDDVVTYALAGYTRLQGESDGWLTLLAAKDNMIKASAFDLPQ